jgi:hypothetical protein
MEIYRVNLILTERVLSTDDTARWYRYKYYCYRYKHYCHISEMFVFDKEREKKDKIKTDK